MIVTILNDSPEKQILMPYRLAIEKYGDEVRKGKKAEKLNTTYDAAIKVLWELRKVEPTLA